MQWSGQTRTVLLTGGVPWGFRLFGGGSLPLQVSKVRRGSKADVAGLREGDVVLSVNGRNFRGKNYQDAVNFLDTVAREMLLEIDRNDEASSPEVRNNTHQSHIDGPNSMQMVAPRPAPVTYSSSGRQDEKVVKQRFVRNGKWHERKVTSYTEMCDGEIQTISEEEERVLGPANAWDEGRVINLSEKSKPTSGVNEYSQQNLQESTAPMPKALSIYRSPEVKDNGNLNCNKWQNGGSKGLTSKTISTYNDRRHVSGNSADPTPVRSRRRSSTVSMILSVPTKDDQSKKEKPKNDRHISKATLTLSTNTPIKKPELYNKGNSNWRGSVSTINFTDGFDNNRGFTSHGSYEARGSLPSSPMLNNRALSSRPKISDSSAENHQNLNRRYGSMKNLMNDRDMSLANRSEYVPRSNFQGYTDSDHKKKSNQIHTPNTSHCFSPRSDTKDSSKDCFTNYHNYTENFQHNYDNDEKSFSKGVPNYSSRDAYTVHDTPSSPYKNQPTESRSYSPFHGSNYEPHQIQDGYIQPSERYRNMPQHPEMFDPSANRAPPTARQNLYSDSTFYDDKFGTYPTVNQLKSMAKNVATSLTDALKKKDGGSKLFAKRRARSERYAYEGTGKADQPDGYPSMLSPQQTDATEDFTTKGWKGHAEISHVAPQFRPYTENILPFDSDDDESSMQPRFSATRNAFSPKMSSSTNLQQAFQSHYEENLNEPWEGDYRNDPSRYRSISHSPAPVGQQFLNSSGRNNSYYEESQRNPAYDNTQQWNNRAPAAQKTRLQQQVEMLQNYDGSHTRYEDSAAPRSNMRFSNQTWTPYRKASDMRF